MEIVGEAHNFYEFQNYTLRFLIVMCCGIVNSNDKVFSEESKYPRTVMHAFNTPTKCNWI